MRRTVLFGLLLLILVLPSVFPPTLVYAGSSESSDVEIVSKITVRGPKGRGKGKPTPPAATGVLGANRPPPQCRWAVVIGISDYDWGTDLEFADDDARDMCGALVDVYGYKEDNIAMLLDDAATREGILGAIGWLKAQEGKTPEEDEIVFFYSGHGARGKKMDADREVTDEGIVPWEYSAEYAIWDGDLASMFGDFDTTRIIFVFDTCFAGGWTDLKADGRVLVMATRENQVAYESSALENGVFSYFFVDEGMIGAEADTYDHDGDSGVSDVTVEEAFDYARANVPIVVPQTPTISDSFDNDLLP